MKNKIIYYDTAPGADDDAAFEVLDIQPFATAEDIVQRTSPPKVATLEQDYWSLDSSCELMDEQPQLIEWGLWSKSMSDSKGTFITKPTLEITFGKQHSSVGISFDFDTNTGEYCTQLKISWYLGTALLGTQTFYPDAPHYACIRKTENYNKLIVSFEKTGKPFRYLRVQGILFGMERIFESDEIGTLNVLEELNPAGIELSINTLHFELRSKSDVPFMFQKKQPAYAYHGESLMGMFFIDKSRRFDKNQYEIDAICAVGVLDESDYMGGIYTGQKAGDVIRQIVGESFVKVEIEQSVADMPLYGYLPVCTKREALAQIGFACGAGISTARSKTIGVCGLPQHVSSAIDDRRIFYGLDVDTSSIVTGTEVTAHTYAQAEEVSELYNGVMSGGENTLKFSEPMHSLNITGGSIVDSGANYAKITAAGTVVLTGKKYMHTTKVTTIKNAKVTAADLANVKKLESTTLVGLHNVDLVSAKFWDYANNRNTANAEIVLKGEQVGDLVQITTPFQGVLVGRINSLDIALSSTLVAKAVITCD